MKIVQIGVGAWGASWPAVVQNHPEWDLASIVDLDPQALAGAAQAADVPPDRCFPSIADALANGIQAEAALVVVPPAAHRAVAVEALEAGLHCLIEKPLADSMADAHAIVEAAVAADRHAMVSQNYRFRRAPRTVRRLLSEGVLGSIETVRGDFQKDPPFEGFRLEMEEPLIVDFLIHHMDHIRGTIGLEPKALRAVSWNPSWSRFAGNACCLIELTTADGARVTYTGSWVSHGKHTTWDGAWDIQGSHGGLHWADNAAEIRFASLFDTVFMQGAVEEDGVMRVRLDEIEYEDRMATLAELATAIRTGQPPETNVRDNLGSVRLVLAALESARTGGKAIDLRDFDREHA